MRGAAGGGAEQGRTANSFFDRARGLAYTIVGVEAASRLATAIRDTDLQCRRPRWAAWVGVDATCKTARVVLLEKRGWKRWAGRLKRMHDEHASTPPPCRNQAASAARCCQVEGRNTPGLHPLTGVQPSCWKHLNTHAELNLTLQKGNGGSSASVQQWTRSELRRMGWRSGVCAASLPPSSGAPISSIRPIVGFIVVNNVILGKQSHLFAGVRQPASRQCHEPPETGHLIGLMSGLWFIRAISAGRTAPQSLKDQLANDCSTMRAPWGACQEPSDMPHVGQAHITHEASAGAANAARQSRAKTFMSEMPGGIEELLVCPRSRNECEIRQEGEF